MAKILIVDDRVTNRELLITLLGYAGHQLLEATDGEEGLAIARAEHPDLIITDIMMPKMDGYEFAHQVRADSSIKNTQIIFYTSSYIVAETLRLASACGVSIVIGKPIEPISFLKNVNEALNTKQILASTPVSEEFHREHMRVLTDTLVNKVELLEVEITERQRIEEKLRQSVANQQGLIDSTDDHVWSVDAQYRLITGNAEFLRYTEKMFGSKLLEGESILQQGIPSEIQNEFRNYLDRAIKGERFVVEMETRLVQPPRYREFCFNPILDASAKSIGVAISSRDITDRKQAEEALRASEQKYSVVFDKSPFAIALTKVPEMYIESVNDAFLKLFEFTRTEVIGRTSVELGIVDQESQAKVGTEFQNHGRVQDLEVTRISKTGKLLNLTLNLDWVTIDDKKYILTTIRDITERKQAEAQIEYQANLLAHINDAIIAVDNQFHINAWNHAAEIMYGWSASEALGSISGNIIRSEMTVEERQEILKQLNEHGRYQSELIQYRKDGQPVYVEASTITLYDKDKQVTGLLSVNRDISARKQAEELIRASEERYRSLFEDSPISFWVEDFSEVKKRLDELKDNGVNDVAAYIRSNPECVKECANLIQVLDVNTAAINLYQANDKADLLGNLVNTAVPMMFDQIEYELIQLANGKLNFEREGIDQTLTGEKIFVNIYWSVVPGYEHSLARVIVSAIDVTEKKRAEQKIHHQLQRLNALRSIDMAISNTLDLNLSLKVLLNATIVQLGVDAAGILLFNRSMNRLEYSAGEGFDTSIIQTTNLRIGEGYAGRVALERKNFYVKNVAGIEGGVILNKLFEGEKFVSYYAVPLIAKGELKGVLEIFQRTELHPDHEWINFLETLAGQAAIAIDNAQLFEGMQRSNLELSLAYDATIEGWSTALDLRDKETEGHSQRVTDMTVALARRMGISESDLIQIRRGSLLHDIGKLGVPDHILLKPDKLNDEEWEVMKKHPIYAHNMLSSIAYLKYALDIPLCHHEKWDGSGYPRGLKNQEIPLAARIFAIVDVWDALTSNRPYRPAWTRERAIEFIKEQSNTHFDPQVVQAFFNMMDNK